MTVTNLDISSRICLPLPMVHFAPLGRFSLGTGVCLGPGGSQLSLAWQGTSHQLLESLSKLLPASWLLQAAEVGTGAGAGSEHNTLASVGTQQGPSMQQHKPGSTGTP